MDIKQLFLETDLKETPIDDYKVYGKPKPSSFSKTDLALINNPKAIEKIKKKFQNTDHIFNFYFINDKAVKDKFAERGAVKSDMYLGGVSNEGNDVRQILVNILGNDVASQIKLEKDAISVIFTGNFGDKKEIMTAWIMAHRIGHAISATRRNNKSDILSNSWTEFEKTIAQMASNIFEMYNFEIPYPTSLNDIIQNRSNEILLIKLFNSIGTFKSARDNNLPRPYEFLYELLAQYLTTGKVVLNDLPNLIVSKARTLRLDPHNAVDANHVLHNYEDVIMQDLERVLTYCHNKVFLM